MLSHIFKTTFKALLDNNRMISHRMFDNTLNDSRPLTSSHAMYISHLQNLPIFFVCLHFTPKKRSWILIPPRDIK